MSRQPGEPVNVLAFEFIRCLRISAPLRPLPGFVTSTTLTDEVHFLFTEAVLREWNRFDPTPLHPALKCDHHGRPAISIWLPARLRTAGPTYGRRESFRCSC